MVSFCFAILNTNYLEHQLFERRTGLTPAREIPRITRRNVGSPKFSGSSTHDLTGVFVKPTKETMLFLYSHANKNRQTYTYTIINLI